jgi:uncharacterized protein
MMEYRPSVKRKALGFSLLFLGVLGTVLPILQGILFLALGLFVLRHQYAWAHHTMERLRRRWPRQVDGVEATEARLIDWFRRQSRKLGWRGSGG